MVGELAEPQAQRPHYSVAELVRSLSLSKRAGEIEQKRQIG